MEEEVCVWGGLVQIQTNKRLSLSFLFKETVAAAAVDGARRHRAPFTAVTRALVSAG